ncbi:aminopeptidase, partial [candidate division GN15 bacterium]|nr:aminopeptidase [candidate division GN15 bacterium]
HAMVLTGVDVRDGRPVKWLVENSWGSEKGEKGMWTMYDSWFDKHVFNVIVKREYVPDEVLKIFEQEPEVLPAWDPLHETFRR